MKELLGFIAILLSIIAHIPYIVDILNKKTKPHIFTWVIWAVIEILAFFGQLQKGGGIGAWSTGVGGIISIAIAILALNKGSRDITRSDKLFFVGALSAIIPWLLTKDPTLSIVILTLINIFAFIPTIRKTIRDPNSETLITYTLNLIRHPLSIVALEQYNVATFLYPAVLFIMNAIMFYVIVKPKLNKNS